MTCNIEFSELWEASSLKGHLLIKSASKTAYILRFPSICREPPRTSARQIS